MQEKRISRFLSRKRDNDGLTQEEMGALIPMDSSNFGKIERGEKNLSFATMWRLEQAFGLTRYGLFNEHVDQAWREPCYATLNRFIRYNVHVADHASDAEPSPLLELLGDTLLETLTINDVERDAAKGKQRQ